MRTHLLFLLLLGYLAVSAQDISAPLLTGSWQSTYHNPALMQWLPQRITVGLPGVANDLDIDRLTYNDIFTEEGDRRILDLNRLPTLLDQRNEFRNSFTLETFGIALRQDVFGISLHHRLRAYGEADYPETLVELVADGNAKFVGETVEFAPLGALTTYHELGLGFSYALNDRVWIGGRLKYLAGIADFRTPSEGSLQLTTGEENYSLTLDQDLVINTAGIIDYLSVREISAELDLNRLGFSELFGGSSGLAVDLGVSVDLDRLRLQASISDIGGINWRDEPTNLTFSGTQDFTGLDVLQDILEDSLSLTDAIDSLEVAFSPVETNASYRGGIDAVYLVGGEYDFTERFVGGLLVALEDRHLGADLAVALQARYALLSWLQGGVNYNYRNGGANIGLHLFATPGPFQLFASTDNLTSLFSTRSSSRASVRLGAALTLGGAAGAGPILSRLD